MSGDKVPTSAIAFLALAAFASQVMVRVTDSLLPQIALDFGTTVGAASVVVSAYAVAHALTQALGTPLGDRFPKYAMVTLMCALSAAATAACGFSETLTSLGAARLACGCTAGTIIPLGMAFVGDAVPYERRQPVLGRFLAGQISGLVAGQIAGGVVGDYLGWRTVFFVIAALFAAIALLLVWQMLSNPLTRTAAPPHAEPQGIVASYIAVFRVRWSWVVLGGVFAEAIIMFGAFAYIGADLHARQGLSFSAVGAVLGAFGLGGLTYVFAVPLLVARLGQTGMVRGGGAMLALSFAALAFVPHWWVAVAAIAVIGLTFYMVHNTLQVNATQMTPQARATAIGAFSALFYLGQSVGVTAAAPVVDRFGAAPIFAIAALSWPLLAFWFAARLRAHQRGG